MKPAAIGSHIYAGGFTIGVSKYFKVLAHFEDTGYGEDVIKLNFKDIDIIKPAFNWPRDGSYDGQKIDFIFANPPCAPFSIMPSMKGKDWRTDERLERTLDVFSLLEYFKPKILAIESVTQAWTQGSGFVLSLVDRANKLGYSSTELLHDSQYLGLPQRRKRTFHIFHNVELGFDTPDFDNVKTLGEAIKQIKTVEKQTVSIPEKFIKYYREAKPGEPLSRVFDRINFGKEITKDNQGRVKGRPRFIISKVNLDVPAPTLIGGFNLMHPNEERFLFLEELQELMGFPKDYKWPTREYNTVSHYLSRGVNPLVAEWLAKGVYESINKNIKITTPNFKLLDWRTLDGYNKDNQTTFL